MEVAIGLGLGIVSGLVTTLLIVLIQTIWKKVIEPWYRELLYSDVRIEGNWSIVYEGGIRKETIELLRVGHKVTGQIIGIAGPDEGKKYYLEGAFKNLMLTASYGPLDQSSLDRGTFTMMLVNNGNTFRGVSSYYEDDTAKIDTDQCEWNRQPS